MAYYQRGKAINDTVRFRPLLPAARDNAPYIPC